MQFLLRKKKQIEEKNASFYTSFSIFIFTKEEPTLLIYTNYYFLDTYNLKTSLYFLGKPASKSSRGNRRRTFEDDWGEKNIYINTLENDASANSSSGREEKR